MFHIQNEHYCRVNNTFLCHNCSKSYVLGLFSLPFKFIPSFSNSKQPLNTIGKWLNLFRANLLPASLKLKKIIIKEWIKKGDFESPPTSLRRTQCTITMTKPCSESKTAKRIWKRMERLSVMASTADIQVKASRGRTTQELHRDALRGGRKEGSCSGNKSKQIVVDK